MKTVERVCKELKALEGVAGAFVLRQSRCVASSLPSQYDSGRLEKVGEVLSRVVTISQKAGYERSAMAFHWPRASLMSWPVGDDGVLALFATPNAVRETINMSVALAIEDLGRVDSNEVDSDATSLKPAYFGSRVPTPEKVAQDYVAIEESLRAIEQLLVEEMGPAGKSLLERCRNKTPRGKGTVQEWLMTLRSVVLADIADPGARIMIGTSHHWAG